MIKFIFVGLFLILQSQNYNIKSIINDIVEKNKQYSNISFTFIISQKINGNIHKSKAFVKYRRSPKSIYYKQFYPKKGVEILYNKNVSYTKVLVNPGGFPWTSLNLDYNSPELRENQHHSIMEANFDYIISVVKRTFNNIDNLKKTFIEDVNYNKTNCYKITYENAGYKFFKYKVKQNETVCSIAKKFNINDYKILEINNLKSYGKVDKDKILILPNDYSKKAVFIIDKKTFLPKNIKIYDEKGLFEELSYFNIKVGLKFLPNEFKKDFKDYNF